ncbi:glycosyltransferase [Paracoccus sp. (in: a-proteobacteria)]|uniref:glycosyltransferase n=1 Tax=Paracoccus sp. TaxID=267 RepID=UPI00289CE55A|nr:glycosyltransferase [Paracoccus sp. (in: a-proteobacteria)]
MTLHRIQIIIPAHNEGGYIADCLQTVLAQDFQGQVEVIVAANGCSDDTAKRAQAMAPRFAQKNWKLTVIEIPEGGKPGALNHADAIAGPGPRIYLDADIRMGAGLLAGIAQTLDTDDARYAGGKLVVAPSTSAISRAYARFWQTLPFVTQGVTGAGLFAVNEAGRKRWGQFPGIISDDTFVRLHFSESERHLVDRSYQWPIAQGFSRLVRVRRRQDNGVTEIAQKYPELMSNQGHAPPQGRNILQLAARDPLGFLTYASVAIAVRIGKNRHDWARGR